MTKQLNCIKCVKCQEIITSKHRHDFVTCSCGAVSVDGGNDYCRMLGEFENILIYKDGKWQSLDI